MKCLAALIGFLAALGFPLSASAWSMTVICTGLVGCGDAPSAVLFNIIPRVAALLIVIAAGTSVIFVVIAGLRMTAMFGDEGNVTKAKNTLVYALGGLGLSLAAAVIVAAVGSENFISGVPPPTSTGSISQYGSTSFLYGPSGPLVAFMTSVVRILITLFNVIFATGVMVGGFRMVMGGGKSAEYQSGFTTVKWAIAGAILVNASRAIVQAFLNLNL